MSYQAGDRLRLNLDGDMSWCKTGTYLRGSLNDDMHQILIDGIEIREQGRSGWPLYESEIRPLW